MKICFDLDDVLCDTYSIILSESLRYHQQILKRKKVKRDVFRSKGDYFYFAKSLGWKDTEVKKFFNEFYPEFLKKCIPYKEVKKEFKELINSGNEIHILTAREQRIDEDVYKITEEWLKQWEIPYTYLSLGEKDKSKYVKNNDIDIFVDDLWENCKNVSKNTDCKVFHMICPYNKFGVYNYKKEEIISITRLYDLVHFFNKSNYRKI